MRFIYAGKGRRSLVCLEYLVSHNYNPALVVGQQGDESGLIAFAKNQGIPTMISEDINSDDEIEKLKKVKPDLLILGGFSQIIKSPVINLSTLGTINLHGGKLPEYRGASVLNWQIINGEKTGGISIIFVDEGIDTGDIIAQATFPIDDHDTIKEVVDKTLKLFPPMLLNVVQKLETGSIQRSKQLSKGKYWRKRRSEDGYFDPKTMTSRQVYNFVRALTKPYPGAFTNYHGKKIIVWGVKVLDKLIRNNKEKIVLQTKDQPVLVTDFS